MEQQAAAEVCVDLECRIIILDANVDDDAGGRLDTASAVGENQEKLFVVDVMISRPDDDHHHPLTKLPNDVENNMNTTTTSSSSSSSSVMVVIDDDDEGPDAGFIAREGGRGGEKEKRKKAAAAKKPPKHRGLVDATDHHHQKKLMIIKELAELAMIKRARIDRMKALIIHKNSFSSLSGGGGGNQLFAMLFTILVFLVLLFQGGIMSCQISCGTFRGSPHPTTEANESSFIFIQED